MDFTAKVAPRLIPSSAENDSPARKEKIARVGNCEKSTKPASREAAEIYALLKLDLLEDMDACAKFVDGVRKVVCPSSFTKHTTGYRKTVLLAIIQMTAILVAEYRLIYQEDTKVGKEVVKVVAAKAYSFAKNIKR